MRITSRNTMGSKKGRSVDRREWTGAEQGVSEMIGGLCEADDDGWKEE